MSLLAVIILSFSCEKGDKSDYQGIIPPSYNFSNVNYSGQTLRLLMLDSISSYLKTANEGAILDATLMKNKYSNTNSPFKNAILDGSGKQLKNKTYLLDQNYFEGLFDSLAFVSLSGNNIGSNGKAGIVNSLNGTKKYLFNENGLEHTQLILKQLMGAVLYYQAIETYLSNFSADDNTTVIAGEGTAMEHHCDEAFGYLGIPTDFPTNTTGLKYWGEYAQEVNSKISCNAPLMNAFIKLRYSISNKDYTTRDAQVIIIKEQFERIVAASAILELTEAKENFADDALRNHVLSEALGFINSLKYNSRKKISQAQIDAAKSSLGTNFYDITKVNIDAAINTINSVYDFDLTKF